jgi:hypothetical protein
MQVRPDPLLYFWRVGLNPAKGDDVRDLRAAAGEPQLEIAVIDWEYQVLAAPPRGSPPQ